MVKTRGARCVRGLLSVLRASALSAHPPPITTSQFHVRPCTNMHLHLHLHARRYICYNILYISITKARLHDIIMTDIIFHLDVQRSTSFIVHHAGCASISLSTLGSEKSINASPADVCRPQCIYIYIYQRRGQTYRVSSRCVI